MSETSFEKFLETVNPRTRKEDVNALLKKFKEKQDAFATYGDKLNAEGNTMEAYGKYMVAFAYATFLKDVSPTSEKLSIEIQKDKGLNELFDKIILAKKAIKEGSTVTTECPVKPLKPEGEGFPRIIGLEGVKQAIRDGVMNPLMYPRLYSSPSRGILLYGPPGTGKTEIVKALAKEIEEIGNIIIHLFTPTASELKGKYFGDTEKFIKGMFKCASETACASGTRALSIIFIDEVESLAASRTSGDQFTTTTVNALLQAIEGVDSPKNVVFMCATNNPWDLDEAFLRRLSVQIYVKMPTTSELVDQLKKKIKTFKESHTRGSFYDEIKSQTCNEPLSLMKIWSNIDVSTAREGITEEQYTQIQGLFDKNIYSASDLRRIFEHAQKKCGMDSINMNVFLKFDNSDYYFSPLMFEDVAIAKQLSSMDNNKIKEYYALVETANKIEQNFGENEQVKTIRKAYENDHPIDGYLKDPIYGKFAQALKDIQIFREENENKLTCRYAMNTPTYGSIEIDDYTYTHLLYSRHVINPIPGVKNIYVRDDFWEDNDMILEYDVIYEGDKSTKYTTSMFVHVSPNQQYTYKVDILNNADYLFLLEIKNELDPSKNVKYKPPTTGWVWTKTETKELLEKTVTLEALNKLKSGSIQVKTNPPVVDRKIPFDKYDLLVNYNITYDQIIDGINKTTPTVKPETITELDEYAKNPSGYTKKTK